MNNNLAFEALSEAYQMSRGNIELSVHILNEMSNMIYIDETDTLSEGTAIPKFLGDKSMYDWFCKQYKYDPKTNTIEREGKRFKVKLNPNKVETAYGLAAGPHTRQTIKPSNYIVLGKGFFSLKNPREAQAILDHEIAHIKKDFYGKETDRKLYNPNIEKENSKERAYAASAANYKEITDKDAEKAAKRDQIIANILTGAGIKKKIIANDINAIKKELYKKLPKEEADRKIAQIEKIQKTRVENIKKYKDVYNNESEKRGDSYQQRTDDYSKYSPDTSNSAIHDTSREFEADDYSAQRNRHKDLLNGIKHVSNNISKHSAEKLDKQVNKISKSPVGKVLDKSINKLGIADDYADYMKITKDYMLDKQRHDADASVYMRGYSMRHSGADTSIYQGKKNPNKKLTEKESALHDKINAKTKEDEKKNPKHKSTQHECVESLDFAYSILMEAWDIYNS